MYKKRISFMLYLLSISLITGCKLEQKEITTKSGLRYTILKEASAGAAVAAAGMTVTVDYTGYLDDHGKNGYKFDSSIGRGPFSFTLGAGQVIKGWDEGVAGMKVDEKRLLVIPADIGYGKQGYPGVIPGGATLRFEVELKKVTPGSAPRAR